MSALWLLTPFWDMLISARRSTNPPRSVWQSESRLMKILNLMKWIFLPFNGGLKLLGTWNLYLYRNAGPKEMPAKVLPVNFYPTHLANSSDWLAGLAWPGQLATASIKRCRSCLRIASSYSFTHSLIRLLTRCCTFESNLVFVNET